MWGQQVSTSSPDAAATGLSDSELQSLLAAARPTWTATASTSAAFGYNDNILLSNVAPVGRSFGRAGIDALLWHLPKAKTDYLAFVNATYTRYSSRLVDAQGDVVDHNTEAFAGLEWRFKQPDWFAFTIDGNGYLLDEVFDMTNFSGRRDVASLNVRGIKAGPTIRVSPWRWIWAEGSVVVDRQRYVGGFNDDEIHESVVRLGLQPIDRIELRGDISQSRRAFSHRHPYDPDLREFLPGLLSITERTREVRLRATIGASRHWSTTTRAGVETYTDNASGDLDFHERHAAQEVEWSAGAWLVRAEGSARHKTYDHQTVGAGSNPPPQIKDEFDAQLRVERKLTAAWTLFLEYTWERSRSNDEEIASYRTNEGLLGARWSWEK
jgi:hypothetical protein